MATTNLFDPSIAQQASLWGSYYGVTVDPLLVKAIIQEESGWNANAIRREPSGVTSYGLMQVLDTTAATLGFKGTPAQLLDPETNIGLGVHYLAKQLARYNGDTSAAVAAYNAGTAVVVDASSNTYKNQGYVDKVLGFLVALEQAAEQAVEAAGEAAGQVVGTATHAAAQKPGIVVALAVLVIGGILLWARIK